MASRRCKVNVADYYAHSLACLFGQFFDNDKKNTRFRRLQAEYAVLISGSCALQFFMDENLPASPLDIFVEKTYARPVIEFLRGIGFRSVDPTITNPDSGPFTFHEQAALFVCLGRGRQRINLMASDGPPLQVILSYHSSTYFIVSHQHFSLTTSYKAVVMDVITHNRAYSFFPKATFEQKLGMTMPPLSGDHDVAREKYRTRGWHITRFTGVHGYRGTQGLDTSNADSDFAYAIRWVGDGKCLSVNLPPVDLKGPTRVVPSIEYSSWRLHAVHNHPTLKLHVLRLRHRQYCCAVPLLRKIVYSDEMRRLRRRFEWYALSFVSEALSHCHNLGPGILSFVSLLRES